MEMNRNQIFMIGLVLLLFGMQFRMIESYVLNERTSTFLANRAASFSNEDSGGTLLASMGSVPPRVVKLPDWLGWAMVSTGSVLILHSLAMKKPGG